MSTSCHTYQLYLSCKTFVQSRCQLSICVPIHATFHQPCYPTLNPPLSTAQLKNAQLAGKSSGLHPETLSATKLVMGIKVLAINQNSNRGVKYAHSPQALALGCVTSGREILGKIFRQLCSAASRENLAHKNCTN